MRVVARALRAAPLIPNLLHHSIMSNRPPYPAVLGGQTLVEVEARCTLLALVGRPAASERYVPVSGIRYLLFGAPAHPSSSSTQTPRRETTETSLQLAADSTPLRLIGLTAHWLVVVDLVYS